MKTCENEGGCFETEDNPPEVSRQYGESFSAMVMAEVGKKIEVLSWAFSNPSRGLQLIFALII